MSYLSVPTADITPNPGQPRKHFDEEALAELAASIKANGLLEPIITRLVDGQHVIIAGERRWRAATLADVTELPVRVLEVDEVKAYELSVAENVNRHDMNPMEEAGAFSQLLAYGRTVEEIASMFGKATRFVTARLDLLQLIPEVARQVADGTIAPSVAQQVAQCNPTNQQQMLFKLMRGDFANDNEALHFAYALKNAEAEISMFEIEEPTEQEREEHKTRKRAAMTGLEQAERMAAALQAVADLTPEQLADVIPDVAAYAARLNAVQTVLTKAKFNARQAKAVAEARVVVVRTEAAS